MLIVFSQRSVYDKSTINPKKKRKKFKEASYCLESTLFSCSGNSIAK